MYELYGPLINLGALSRCPIRFSGPVRVFVPQVAVINLRFMFISLFDFVVFWFLFFFVHLPFFRFWSREPGTKHSSLLGLVN